MIIVSTSEFRENQRKYFDLAEKEKVMVRRGNKYIKLFVSDKPDGDSINETWLKSFLSIPAKYRCNPFEMSASGDLYWADKRNVEYVENQSAISEQQIKEGKHTTVRTLDELNKHLDSL